MKPWSQESVTLKTLAIKGKIFKHAWGTGQPTALVTFEKFPSEQNENGYGIIAF